MTEAFVEVMVGGASNPRPTLFRVGVIDRVAPVFGVDDVRTLLVSSGVSYALRDEYEDVKRKIAAAMQEVGR